MKKSQITIVELPLLFLLFLFIVGNLFYSNDFSQVDHKLSIDSFLDSVYNSNEFRKQIMFEDLSTNNIVENWSNLSLYLNNSFSNYEFIISNSSVDKYIFSCNSSYNKIYSQRIVSIYNNSVFEFRKITLGVCY